jgi:hypothetical protein
MRAQKAAKLLAVPKACGSQPHRSTDLFTCACQTLQRALEAFVGEYVLPISDHLHWFWFSRYGRVGFWEVRFRFSTANLDPIENKIQYLTTKFSYGADGCGHYDFINDLGATRFLGQDAVNQQRERRATRVYEFLSASARLFVESIVKDPNGYWRHETETNSKLNRETSLESIHHLFCNMTGVPTWAALLATANSQLLLLSDMQARQILTNNSQLRNILFERIQH